MRQTAETPRQRLMRALAVAAAEKGYASVTIADIVGNARVSKRTFYEHFADKEACLLALYEQTGDHLLAVMSAVVPRPDQPLAERVRAVAAAYIGALERVPGANRTLLLEMQSAGARAYRMRTRTLTRFADLLRTLVEDARRSDPAVRPLSPMVALALVGGVNELMVHAVDPYGTTEPDPTGATGAGRSFADLLDPVVELVTAVLAPRH